MAEFVCPEFDYEATLEIDPRKRLLVAFPHVVARPERTYILDSGAFAMSKQKSRWPTGEYINQLASWYAANWREGMLCIAPDVYPDPWATMRRFEQYLERFSMPLTPVVQGHDWYQSRKQIQLYARYDVRSIALSNPAMRYPDYAKLLAYQIELVRDQLGDIPIHALGAGWTPEEARLYRALSGLDSFDTIAYYTQAQEPLGYAGNVHWTVIPQVPLCTCPACQHGLSDWRYVALHNACAYQGIA